MSARSRSRSRGRRGSGGRRGNGCLLAVAAVRRAPPSVPFARAPGLPLPQQWAPLTAVGEGPRHVTVAAVSLGMAVTLTVVPDNTVADIKAMLQDHLGIPPGQQRLELDIIELWDELTVRLLGLGVNNNHCVLRLCLEPVPIAVQFLSGRVVHIHTTVDTSCDMFKDMVQDATGIPYVLRLYSAGRELNHGTLYQHGIGEGSIICLFLIEV